QYASQRFARPSFSCNRSGHRRSCDQRHGRRRNHEGNQRPRGHCTAARSPSRGAEEVQSAGKVTARIADCFVCYSSIKRWCRLKNTGSHDTMELISPTDLAKEKVQAVQDYTILSLRSLGNLFRKPLYVADMIQQADLIGVGSLPIVVLIGFFTGAVLAVQSANTLQRFGSITLIGQLVALSMVRELGPVLTGILVAGRNSSGMASELWAMDG